MISFNEVQAQLVSLSPALSFIGISEVRKLSKTLEPNEKILECMKVWHKGRSTILCVTSDRIVCLDVRSQGHSLPHISYADVKGVLVQQKTFFRSVCIHTINGIVQFTMWRSKHARALKYTIDRHLDHLRDTYQATTITQKIIKPAYTARNWRSLVKKVGAASLAN